MGKQDLSILSAISGESRINYFQILISKVYI